MALSLRERRRLLLREEILDAAGTLVKDKGYAAMSMDELAAQVGISKPTLYSYFATKEDLVVDMFTRKAEQLFATISQEQENAQRSPIEQLLLILQLVLTRQAEDGAPAMRPGSPELFQILCAHPQSFGYMERLEALITSLIHQGLQQGEIDPRLNPEGILLAFFGCISAMNLPAFQPRDASSDKLIATFLTMFEKGIRLPTQQK